MDRCSRFPTGIRKIILPHPKATHPPKLRRAVTPWGIPTEVWRQLLLPSWQWNKDKHGVGYTTGNPFSLNFQFVLFRLLQSIRVHGRAPTIWQQSMATELDKKKGKSGPAGIRIINTMEHYGSVWKVVFAALWKRGTSYSQLFLVWVCFWKVSYRRHHATSSTSTSSQATRHLAHAVTL